MPGPLSTNLGTPLQDVLGDAVLEIDIIPNIARCASMVGVAREYAALTDQALRYPDYEVVMEGEPLGSVIVSPQKSLRSIRALLPWL